MWNYHFDKTRPTSAGEPMLDYIEFSRSIYGHSRPFHTHPECHVLFCTKGHAFLRINDVDLDINTGMLAVIPPGTLHSFGPKEDGLEFWGISLSPAGSEDELARFLSECQGLAADFSGYLDYVQGAFLFIYETAHRMTECQAAEADRVIRSQTTVLLYFARSMFSVHPHRHPLPQEGSMDKVIHWMIEHYAESITLDSLAERFSLSPSHFSRKFQEAFQVSPINYLIDYRIDVAKDLLIHTDKPVGEIAAEVGYANPYHFSSLFSRRTGMSPQQMRAVCRHSTTQPEAVHFPGEGTPD